MRSFFLLLALASLNVIASEEPSLWQRLVKRQNFSDPSIYHMTEQEWAAAYERGQKELQQGQAQGSPDTNQKNQVPAGQQSSQQTSGGNEADKKADEEDKKGDEADRKADGADKKADEEDKKADEQDKQQDQSSNSQTDSNGGSSSSSAKCSDGCSMTIAFSDDTLDVDFAAGNGGKPSTGKTKGGCICMSPGSVRVNVGSTNTGDHGTLIEGNAQGESQWSMFDVSYVEGYNYPVTCWNKDKPNLMSGSNIDLYAHGKCHDGGDKMGHICVNPGYTKLATRDPAHECMKCTLPSPFFGPAAGAAYTYPYDDCPCASGPHKDGPYASPMANGQHVVCCVGPQCRKNTFSIGGQTAMGNCDRGDCMPCAGMGAACSTKCGKGQKRDIELVKRDLERVFENAPEQPMERKVRKRHQHHQHHHGAELHD